MNEENGNKENFHTTSYTNAKNEKEIEENIERNHQEIIELKKQGDDLFKLKNYSEAIKIYTDTISLITKKFSEIYEEEDEKQAKFLIEKYGIPTYLNLSRSYFKENDYSNVINICSKVIEIQPENPKSLYLRCNSYLNINDLDSAEEDLMTLKRITKPESEEITYLTKVYNEKLSIMKKQKGEKYKKMMKKREEEENLRREKEREKRGEEEDGVQDDEEDEDGQGGVRIIDSIIIIIHQIMNIFTYLKKEVKLMNFVETIKSKITFSNFIFFPFYATKYSFNLYIKSLKLGYKILKFPISFLFQSNQKIEEEERELK